MYYSFIFSHYIHVLYYNLTNFQNIFFLIDPEDGEDKKEAKQECVDCWLNSWSARCVDVHCKTAFCLFLMQQAKGQKVVPIFPKFQTVGNIITSFQEFQRACS